jgi:hypothetical protein
LFPASTHSFCSPPLSGESNIGIRWCMCSSVCVFFFRFALVFYMVLLVVSCSRFFIYLNIKTQFSYVPEGKGCTFFALCSIILVDLPFFIFEPSMPTFLFHHCSAVLCLERLCKRNPFFEMAILDDKLLHEAILQKQNFL